MSETLLPSQVRESRLRGMRPTLRRTGTLERRERQDQVVLDALIDFREERLRSPTKFELAKDTGLHISSVETSVARLEAAGAITWDAEVEDKRYGLLPLRIEAYEARGHAQ